MAQDVYKISSNGERVWECSFANDFDARHNMISLLMILSGRTNGITIESERDKFANKIKQTIHNVWFELGEDVYIMRK